jgi:hypothetical protein
MFWRAGRGFVVRALAVIADSPSLPRRELAEELKKIGYAHVTLDYAGLSSRQHERGSW